MSAPLIWIIFPLIFGILLFFIKNNYSLAYTIQIGFCLVLVLIALISQFSSEGKIIFLGSEMESTFDLLGRSFNIDENFQFIIIMFYLLLGFWTFSLYLFQIESLIIPLGLVVNALLLSAISISPFLYSGLLIELAILAGVPILLSPKSESHSGITKLLIAYSIGMILILLAGWYLAGGEISPVNDAQLVQATFILGLGFIFWLAIFPAHSWVPLVSEESSPFNSFYILILLPVAITILLIKYLDGFSWLRSYALVFIALRVFGAIMVFTGAMWAYFQKGLMRFFGFLSLFNSGLIILAISLQSSEGYILAAYHLLPRLIILSTLSWAIIIFVQFNGYSEVSELTGFFFKKPIISSAFIFSLFSLVGMPLTPGFPTMLSLLALTTKNNRIAAVMLFISIILLSIRFIQWVNLLIKRDFDMEIQVQLGKTEVFFLLTLLLGIIMGLFPNTFLMPFESIVSNYEFLVQ